MEGGIDDYINISFASVRAEGERSVSCLGRFNPGKTAPEYELYEAEWASESAWTKWRTENSSSYQDWNSDSSVVRLLYRGSSLTVRLARTTN
jgi:hypothetical protein